MERRILRNGRPLAGPELGAARNVRVRNPERIRVAAVPEVPIPGFGWIRRLVARLGFDGSLTSGMALRYGIFVRRDCAGDPRLLPAAAWPDYWCGQYLMTLTVLL